LQPTLEPGPLVGAHFALFSILTFFLPLATALLGAWLADHSPVSQLLGGLSGLFAGMLVVRLCVIVCVRIGRGEP